MTASVPRLATLASQFRSALETCAPTTLPIGLQASHAVHVAMHRFC